MPVKVVAEEAVQIAWSGTSLHLSFRPRRSEASGVEEPAVNRRRNNL